VLNYSVLSALVKRSFREGLDGPATVSQLLNVSVAEGFDKWWGVVEPFLADTKP
jgi:hypothetical protein